MRKMTKIKLNRLVTQSKRFTFTSRKGGKEKKDAKSNGYHRNSDMRYLHCVNLVLDKISVDGNKKIGEKAKVLTCLVVVGILVSAVPVSIAPKGEEE